MSQHQTTRGWGVLKRQLRTAWEESKLHDVYSFNVSVDVYVEKGARWYEIFYTRQQIECDAHHIHVYLYLRDVSCISIDCSAQVYACLDFFFFPCDTLSPLPPSMTRHVSHLLSDINDWRTVVNARWTSSRWIRGTNKSREKRKKSWLRYFVFFPDVTSFKWWQRQYAIVSQKPFECQLLSVDGSFECPLWQRLLLFLYIFFFLFSFLIKHSLHKFSWFRWICSRCIDHVSSISMHLFISNLFPSFIRFVWLCVWVIYTARVSGFSFMGQGSSRFVCVCVLGAHVLILLCTMKSAHFLHTLLLDVQLIDYECWTKSSSYMEVSILLFWMN